MTEANLLAFAFLVGLVAAGLTGTLAELRYRRAVSFKLLFSVEHRPITIGVLVAAAGPYMLVNDAIAARQRGRIGLLSVFGCLATSGMWLVALGTVTLELGWRVFRIAL